MAAADGSAALEAAGTDSTAALEKSASTNLLDGEGVVQELPQDQPPQTSDSAVTPLTSEAEAAVVRVGGEDCLVDLAACAPQAAFFAGIHKKRRKAPAPSGVETDVGSVEVDMELQDFPGGVTLLRDVVRYLHVIAAEERAATAAVGELGAPEGLSKVDPTDFHLELNTDNIGSYLEAAAVLRCPRLLRDTVLAPAAKDLSSRRVLTLLERVIMFTADVANPEALSVLSTAQVDESGAASPRSEHGESALDEASKDLEQPVTGPDGPSQEQVVQAFSQVIQRLCARLDAVDFKLTAALAAGCPWASLEVLRAFRVKVENVGRMNYALQSVTSTVKSLFTYEEKQRGTPQQLKQDWNEHHFSLHVFRKHVIEATLFSNNTNLRASAELAMLEQENDVGYSDDGDEGSAGARKPVQQGDDDIPEAICDGVTESTLQGLSGFVAYCDAAQTPPVLAATMIRCLLLVEQTDRARRLFEAVFVRSRKAQAMVVTGHIPIQFLSAVRAHRAASVVLRRLLAQYESIDNADLCHLLGVVLLEEFKSEKHCQDIVLSNALIRCLVIHCRVQTRAVEGTLAAPSSVGGTSVFSGASGDMALLRLRKVGERLFNATFVIHNGFLPTSEELKAGESCHAGQLGEAECPWDTGELDLLLLQHVPESEDALHLARRVLLRGLSRNQRDRSGVESDVPAVARLWPLGHWAKCRNLALISEAFKFLCHCWQGLRAGRVVELGVGPEASPASTLATGGSVDRLADEEALFSMFSELEFWLLPPAELLTPWAPPQLLACHVAARCKSLSEQQHLLAEDNHHNLAEINRLRSVVSQLSAKLEAVDSRSVQSMQKQSEVAETLRSLR